MVALTRKRITAPLAPLVAGVLAAFVALVVALMPADMLGKLVLASGIAALVPAAEPPLGADPDRGRRHRTGCLVRGIPGRRHALGRAVRWRCRSD
jgi:hypothetical protein